MSITHKGPSQLPKIASRSVLLAIIAAVMAAPAAASPTTEAVAFHSSSAVEDSYLATAEHTANTPVVIEPHLDYAPSDDRQGVAYEIGLVLVFMLAAFSLIGIAGVIRQRETGDWL